MKKLITEMTSKELITAHKKAEEWLNQKFQKTGTDLAEDGTPYNHKLFIAGLTRYEQITDEIRERTRVHKQAQSTDNGVNRSTSRAFA